MSDRHEDFDREISMLRESRPSLTPLELDRARSRARRAAHPPSRGAWQRVARTRGAVVALLAVGTLLSTGGTSLAISGLGSSGAASSAQYTGSGTGTGGGTTGSGTTTTSETPAGAVSPAEQAEQPAVTTSGELPFTGFLAIPVLLVGLVLVAAGLAGRRSLRRQSTLPPG
jgi:hypothetical protein